MRRQTTALYVVALTTTLALSGLEAAEFAPRVVSPHNADAYSMRTFAEYERWRDLKGDAKVLAVYEYLSDTRTGLYPMGAGAWEGGDDLYEFGYIRDPVKMINVYSLGYCDMLGPTLEGVFEDMGMGPARTVSLPGLHHVFTEVRVGERWAYVDLDLRAVFLRPDGTLASTEDARRDPSLWSGPTGPRFFPMDQLESLRRSYQSSPVEVRYGVSTGGHTMDYVLRRGETFTRWWKPQGDRWNHHPSYHERLRAVLEREPKGPKCKHGEAYTIHTRGNGRFVYEPDLTSGSLDFADGAYDWSNVEPSARGLALSEEGEGYAVFEVRTPYVIVPTVGAYETPEDDRDASVVELDADGATLEISVDNGLTWRALTLEEGRVDLTPHVAGRYGYLLRASLRGSRQSAVVRGLKVTTWVQVHPASLPSLRRGRNVLRYVTGDHYGLQTRVMEIRTQGSDGRDLLRLAAEPPTDFDPSRGTSRVRGPLVVQVESPPRTRIAWFSAGGAFATHQRGEARRTQSSIAYATEAPEGFREVYRASIPDDQSHWHTSADVEVRLEEPTRELYLRYVGAPAVNHLRIYAHCIEDAPRPPRPGVRVTHGWRESGELRRRTVNLRDEDRYEIVCESDPEDEFIEIAVR